MNFEHLKRIEPDLGRLEESARFAGSRGATWIDVSLATNEALTKCCGRGAVDERLQSAQAYEVARAALFAAWSRGAKCQSPPPEPPPFADGEQRTFLNTSEAYQ